MTVSPNSPDYVWRQRKIQQHFDGDIFNSNSVAKTGVLVDAFLLLLYRSTVYHSARFVEDNRISVGAWIGPGMTYGASGFERWCMLTMCCAVCQLPADFLRQLGSTGSELLRALGERFELEEALLAEWRPFSDSETQSHSDCELVQIHLIHLMQDLTVDISKLLVCLIVLTLFLFKNKIRTLAKDVNLRILLILSMT